MPGSTRLTQTPLGRNWWCRASLHPTTPNFEAVYAGAPPTANRPATDATFTTLDGADSSSIGMNAAVHLTTPKKLVAITASRSSSAPGSYQGRSLENPALLINTSHRP